MSPNFVTSRTHNAVSSNPQDLTASRPIRLETHRPASQPSAIMSYRYEFDDTCDGDLRLRRTCYEILQDAYRGLRDELDAWNRRALEHGGSTPPYEQEVGDLNRMLAWGDEQLAHAGASEVTVRGISIASSRYAKAALTLAIHRRQVDREEKSRQGWPDAALRPLDEGTQRIRRIADVFEHEPSDVLWQLIPKHETPERAVPPPPTGHWDIFISHADEDKEDFVRPLAGAPSRAGPLGLGSTSSRSPSATACAAPSNAVLHTPGSASS